MSVGIYARFSSENQRDSSIEDQERVCRRLCLEKGWTVVDVYADHALSGATTLRPSYQRLLADVRAGKIKVVVAEGLDRLTRDQATAASLFQLLNYLGVMIFTRAEGEVNELHVGMKGTFNALALKDLALKTHRGVEGRVRKGFSGGGRAYGYRAVRQQDADGNPLRGMREIVTSEAAIVLRIFQEFAAGRSPRAIARGLNGDGIPGPSGKPWRDTTIRGHATRRTGIVRNSTYIGQPEWNKQVYMRNPETGKRVARVRPAAEHIVSEVPALRIITQELWIAVQKRLERIRQSPASQKQRKTGFWEHRRPKHLLTGLVYCGACGGLMSAVGKDYLACSAARSGAGCQNRKGIRRDRVEAIVLEGLKTRLMAPELVKEFVAAFLEEVKRQRATGDARAADHRSELDRVSKKLKGLYDAVADGLRTPGLKAELERLEARQATLHALIAAAPPRQPWLHPNLTNVYRSTVADLSSALAQPETRSEATEILRGLVQRIMVTVEGDSYVIELVGDIARLLTLPGGSVPEEFASSVKVVAGAGFEPTTFRL